MSQAGEETRQTPDYEPLKTTTPPKKKGWFDYRETPVSAGFLFPAIQEVAFFTPARASQYPPSSGFFT